MFVHDRSAHHTHNNSQRSTCSCGDKIDRLDVAQDAEKTCFSSNNSLKFSSTRTYVRVDLAPYSTFQTKVDTFRTDRWMGDDLQRCLDEICN